jgi:hypothetical protein
MMAFIQLQAYNFLFYQERNRRNRIKECHLFPMFWGFKLSPSCEIIRFNIGLILFNLFQCQRNLVRLYVRLYNMSCILQTCRESIRSINKY